MQKNLDQNCLMTAEDFVLSIGYWFLIESVRTSADRGAAAQRSDLSGFPFAE